MMRPTRHPRGDMGEDQVAPSELRHQPISGGEIHPGFPLVRRDLAAYVHAVSDIAVVVTA